MLTIRNLLIINSNSKIFNGDEFLYLIDKKNCTYLTFVIKLIDLVTYT